MLKLTPDKVCLVQQILQNVTARGRAQYHLLCSTVSSPLRALHPEKYYYILLLELRKKKRIIVHKCHHCVSVKRVHGPYPCIGAAAAPEQWKWTFCHRLSLRCHTLVSSDWLERGCPCPSTNCVRRM